jgi:MoaA/NifB/PqqE/SkfB family radical SAM enzyme
MREQNLVLDGHKLAWHRERVEAWLNGERIAPITIDCALTRRCTYNCVYCYSKLQIHDEHRMTRDIILHFLDDAAEIGVKAISLVSDGESTCSPYLYDAIVRGHKNGLDMALGTNGYLLKMERLEEILPALTYLRFNISAGEKDAYNRVMGAPPDGFDKVREIVRECVRIKKEKGLSVTLGLQMVLLPEYEDQVVPLAKLGRDLGVDYLVIKHCSDDEFHHLGVDYSKYFRMTETLKEAETYSTGTYLVKAKWSKILSGGGRKYSRCYGAPFMPQFSGSGLVAPCGMLFNSRYKEKFHIADLTEKSFKEIWRSDRYWEVMDFLASDKFDARTDCAALCLQHKINEYLWELKQGTISLSDPSGEPPDHINFI